MRYLTGLVILIAASTACSRGNDRPIADSPTSPSAVTATLNQSYISMGVISTPMVVGFPGRDQSKRFRDALETYYATVLGRAGAGTFVDVEGEIVWLQEYLRYRVNGCDHATSLSRVLAQIDGAIAGALCADVDPFQNVPFPARTDTLDARRTLETRYQQMGRGLSITAVDIEGAGIWIAEYLRYRASGCDHDTASQKVFAQIAGAAPPATCFVPCSYRLTPDKLSTGSGASSQMLEIRPNAATMPNCEWTATSSASWLQIDPAFVMGTGFVNVPYTIAVNHGNARTAYIGVTWRGGSARLAVDQEGTPFNAGFTLVDPFRGPSNTEECHLRSSNTPCVLSAFANLPGNNYVYSWSVSYPYGSQKLHTQTGPSASFTFYDQCGGTGSTTEGLPVDMTVILTITDDRGNTITLQSGAFNQPTMRVRQFTC